MTQTRWVVRLLRVLLVVLFAALVVGQVLAVPGQFSGMAGEQVEIARLRWPLTVLGILGLLGVQVVVVCTWRLLTMVQTDRIFRPEAFRWVDGIVWAVLGGWLALAAGAGAVVVTMYVTPELRDPGLPMALGGVTLVGLVGVLLMVVMRALLRQAAALQTEMDEVV